MLRSRFIAALTLTLAVLGLGGALTVRAATTPIPDVQSRGLAVSEADQQSVIRVSGTGQASGEPDLADVTVGADTVASDPATAIDENTARMTRVLRVLRDQFGIAERDLQTVGFNIRIEEVRDRGVPTGERRFHVSNRVRVRVRDVGSTGLVLQQVLAAGANTVGSVVLRVDDQTALERLARERAVDDLKAKAEQIAARLDVQLARVLEVSETGIVVPSPVLQVGAATLEAAQPVPIATGEFTVVQRLQGVFEIVP